MSGFMKVNDNTTVNTDRIVHIEVKNKSIQVIFDAGSAYSFSMPVEAATEEFKEFMRAEKKKPGPKPRARKVEEKVENVEEKKD